MPLTVKDTTYDKYQPFAQKMQEQFPLLGIQLNNRLYRIIGAALDNVNPNRVFTKVEESDIAALKKKAKFDDWDDLAQFLYSRKLIAPKATGFVPHRPRNLGARPPWIKPVNSTRPRKQGMAIRHIVPSHLLGYAAENAIGSVKDDFGLLLDAYCSAYSRWTGSEIKPPALLKFFDKVKPVMTESPSKEWTARRFAWALLYNHPGNLWVGNAEDNQIIGFMYATAYGILFRLKTLLEASGDSLASPNPKTKGTEKKIVTDALHTLQNISGSDGLRGDISDVIRGTLDDAVTDGIVSVSDVVCFVEDVAANLQLDIPRLNDWELVQDWREKFIKPGMSAAELASFLEVDFNGSLTASGAKPEF